MDESETDAGVQRRAAAALHEIEQDLDSEIRDQLATRRRAAVAAADGSRPPYYPWLLGFGGSAATAAVLVALSFSSAEPEPPPLDLVEFAVAQETELLEDLEFVAWMMLEAGAELESLNDSPASS